MLYFDSSIVAPLLRAESTSVRVESWISGLPAGELATSQWTCLEILSLLAREVRVGRFDTDVAQRVDGYFEGLLSRSFELLVPGASDFETAKSYLRRYETGLRGGDALHLAVAANRGATRIFSLDKGMVKAGKMLGLPVETGID